MADEFTTTIEQLEKYVSYSPEEREEIKKNIENHPMSVNQYYMDLIDWNDPDDPIRKMAIPSMAENTIDGDFDTSGEQQNTKLQGLQHKYAQTALILAANSCVMYCRHCFRKRLVGINMSEIAHDWEPIVNYVSEHKEITNILISGGDPLMLDNASIKCIFEKFSPIEHLNFIRIGSRIPVVDPEKIINNPELISMLKDCSENRKKVYLTTQFNHPREITPLAIKAINIIKAANIIINNQTVLLKGVNDTPEIMAELQAGLSKIGVVPYYVFQCRPVKKVKNIFQVPFIQSLKIVEGARVLLDGLSKRFRFVMSHKTGKIELLGYEDGHLFYKYHQSTPELLDGKIYRKKIAEDECWLDQ
jgi:KamA family protein